MEVILKAFKFCGLSRVTYDSEDGDATHCLELVKMEAEAAPEFAWFTSELESQDYFDPFSDRDDEDEPSPQATSR